MEVWKDIPGYEGRYQASTEGRIRSVDRIVYSRSRTTRLPFPRQLKGQILRPGKFCKTGHLSVVLGRKAPGSPVHQLVMKTFVGEPLPGQEVRHKNGVPTDNRLANLEYGTRTENILDVYRQGKAWRALTIDDVREIRKRIAAGDRNVDIAKDYDVSDVAISSIRHRRCYAWLE